METMKYSKICEFIKDKLDAYIPKQYVDVMFDSLNSMYIVKIKNQFGDAQYRFPWSHVITYGVSYIVDTIKNDYVLPRECEE